MKRLPLLLLALFLGSVASLHAADFRVVAHVDVPVSVLTKSAASAIFYKRTARWPNGRPVVPVDQNDKSPVRAAFTAAIHGKRVAAVKSYWQQQIFAGLDVPPVEKEGDAAVLAFIRATPGAIGYVSAAAPITGVKVIEIR